MYGLLKLYPVLFIIIALSIENMQDGNNPLWILIYKWGIPISS